MRDSFLVATVSVASNSAGDTPAATELNGAFKTLDKVLMLIRAAVSLQLHSKSSSAVSRGALMLRLSFMFQLLLSAQHRCAGVVTRRNWHNRAVVVDGVDAIL